MNSSPADVIRLSVWASISFSFGILVGIQIESFFGGAKYIVRGGPCLWETENATMAPAIKNNPIIFIPARLETVSTSIPPPNRIAMILSAIK